MDYIEEQVFERLDLQKKERFAITTYEGCTFKNCDFSSGRLSGVVFIDCKFISCNLSNAIVEKSSLRDVIFSDCKLTGVAINTCNPSMMIVTFRDCILDYVSFEGLSLKKTEFTNCSMIRTFFINTDLSGSVLANCNLENAVFQKSNLEKVDFTTSYNFTIDPEENRMKKSKFVLHSLIGLLGKYDIIVE